MSGIRTTIATCLLAASIALLPTQAGAAEMCSAWAEPARVEEQIQLRKRHRMRADQKWVLEVAGNPEATFGYDGILMSPQEQQEFQARFTRSGDNSRKHNAMVQQAAAYAERQTDSFAGSYLRRTSEYLFDPPVAFVLKFTGDLAVHQQALQNLPPANIPLEILPARFSLRQLETGIKTWRERYESLPEKDSIRWLTYGVDVYENVIKVEVESYLADGAARLEAGFGGMVKVIAYPMYDEFKRVSVTEGPGWRLLGRAEHHDGTRQKTTLAATSEIAWRKLRRVTQIANPVRRVDFRKEIVLAFATSIGCSEMQLDDVVINRSLQSITPEFWHAGSPGRICTASYVGYEVFAVAVDREALPPNPITVPADAWGEDVANPDYCPRGLIIPPP